ncbi:cell wall-active antibiotics response protein [bacterium]|nr:cell wall-active antibiotics response protein [bacterium]
MSRHHSKFTSQLWVGALAIAIGLVFLLDNFGLVEARNIMRFWPSIFIVIGAVKIVQGRSVPSYFVGGVFIAIGSMMIAHKLGLIYFRLRDWWPVFLIVIGIAVLIKAWYRRLPQGASEITDQSDTINAMAILGGYRHRDDSQNFLGGEVTSVMGGVELDLRHASIQNEAALDFFVLWGGVELKVPADWQVVVQSVPILGGVDDRSYAAPGSNKKLLIKGMVLMGGIEIKN